MNEVDQNLEACLADAYREETRYYSEALRIAEQLPGLLREGAGVDSLLPRMMQFFEQIGAVEARLAVAKERWRQRGQPTGPDLRKAMDELADLIEKLVKHVHAAEQEAIIQRDRLIPQLDAGIRAKRMQQVYRQGN